MTDFAFNVPDKLLDEIAERVAAKLATPERPGPTPTADGKLAVPISEAADLLGCSPDHFKRHVLPELRIVRSGRLRLVPVVELERWIDRRSARALARGTEP